jgi:hypothetical protein
VAEYIQQLQGRAIMLDSEHERLINTIRCTTEATTTTTTGINNNNTTQSDTSSNGDNNNNNNTPNHGNAVPNNEMMDGVVAYRNSINNNNNNNDTDDCGPISSDSLLFVPGIDYEAVFVHCPYPLGVATLDGRLIAANREFESLLNPNYTAVTTVPMNTSSSSYYDLSYDGSTTKSSSSSTGPSNNNNNNTMIDQSFFVFIRNHQEIFEAMAALLKQSTASIERGEGTITTSPNLLFWHGHVVSSRNEMVGVCLLAFFVKGNGA